MFKRLLSITLAVAMLTSVVPLKTQAAAPIQSNVVQLKTSVTNVVFLLKEVFNDRYSMVEQEIKDLIKEKGYDYSLSIDSFYDQPNPFKDADYIRYLSAYMSCKKYAQEKGEDTIQLREIPFLSYEVTEQTSTEYVPTTVPRYYQSDRVLDEFIQYGEDYILEPTEIDVYEQQENGHYKKTGEKEMVNPQEKEVKFVEVKLKAIKPDDIFKEMGIDKELVGDDYERRVDMIRRVISNRSIAQTMFINLPTIAIDSNDALAEYGAYIEQAEGIRKIIVETALSLVNKVPYEWAGKPTHPGYDTIWWSYNEENGLQHGLDCSGFVQWTYMTSGFPKEIYGKMMSTKAIKMSSLKRIERDELRPGDIGVTNRLGVNHTGIYIGDGLWCHCSSDKKTVAVTRYASFSVYYSPADQDVAIDQSVIEEYARGNLSGDLYTNSYNISKSIDTQNSFHYTYNYSYNDEVILAKFITLKAKSEGMNCWIAVGEVMRNRVASDMFPNDMYAVVYQNAGKAEIAETEPAEEILNVAHMVLTGQLAVLNNDRAVFFVDTRDLKEEEDTEETEETEYTEESEDEDSESEHQWDSYPWFTTINDYVFYSL